MLRLIMHRTRLCPCLVVGIAGGAVGVVGFGVVRCPRDAIGVGVAVLCSRCLWSFKTSCVESCVSAPARHPARSTAASFQTTQRYWLRVHARAASSSPMRSFRSATPPNSASNASSAPRPPPAAASAGASTGKPCVGSVGRPSPVRKTRRSASTAPQSWAASETPARRRSALENACSGRRRRADGGAEASPPSSRGGGAAKRMRALCAVRGPLLLNRKKLLEDLW